MADPITAKMDLSGINAGLASLNGPLRESLARSMAVAGGQVIRDEAILLAPVGTAAAGSLHPGALRAAIYLAFKTDKTTPDQVVYSVSWNAKKAPHGHLVEFGYWQPFVVAHLADGTYVTTKVRLPEPKWIAAHPFLRPAFDMTGDRALAAMIERGKERLPELLANPTDGTAES